MSFSGVMATATPARAKRYRSRKTGAAPIPGAIPAPFPGFIQPCLATLRARPPEGSDWIHEIKYDGYRTQAQLRDEKCTLYTRRGYKWTRRFWSIAEGLSALRNAEVVLDGEVVVLDEQGLPDFHQLQTDLAQSRTDRLTYFVFDLLYLTGHDLRPLPLERRKHHLANLIEHFPEGRVRLSQHLDAEGADVFMQACAMGLEGIISKRRDAPYRSGRQDTWIKSKCLKSDTYPVVAFVEKLGARPRRIASLYVGRREGKQLLYAGKVGTGYTEMVQRDLRERLDPLIRRSSPLSVPVKKPKATWVQPELEAEVQYGSLTSGNLLRQAVFKGLRDDLATEPIPPRTRSPASTTGRTSDFIRVPKENILQLLPDAATPSKAELTRYWTKVSTRALKYLARRPLKLVRAVHGTTFYHKGPLPRIPDAVHQLKVQKREGGEGTRLWVDSLAGLLGLVEIGAVELHPWNATVDDIEHADQIVFDLDPGEAVAWDFVKDTALALRELLQSEGLSSWPKLTGGKGIHVMVPLDRLMTHDVAHQYSKDIARRLERQDPSRYTIAANLAARPGRLFIDYLRNGRGTTAVGAYSPRARPGFPIAAPTTWKQIERGIKPDAFTIRHPPISPSPSSERRVRQD
jgi:bifunctional non-homologous end joining protein LigD